MTKKDGRISIGWMQLVSSWVRASAIGMTVVGYLVSMAGCSSMQSVEFKNPFSVAPPAYKSQYGLTPAQKVDRLRQLADRACGMSPAQQATTTRELISTFENERDPILRRELVRTLGGMATLEATEGLQMALDDDNEQVRIVACEAWGRRNDARSVDMLASVLSEDDDVDVRLAASQALARRADRSSLVHMAATLEDRDPAVQLATMQSLRSATGESIGDNIDDWKVYLAGATQSLESPKSRQFSTADFATRLASGEATSPLIQPPVYEDVSSGATASETSPSSDESIFR